MSQAELSRKTGLSSASITRILFGEQKASHEAIKAIVRATRGKVTAQDLITGRPRAPEEKRRSSASMRVDMAAA